jgi:hypothetical protein
MTGTRAQRPSFGLFRGCRVLQHARGQTALNMFAVEFGQAEFDAGREPRPAWRYDLWAGLHLFATGCKYFQS